MGLKYLTVFLYHSIKVITFTEPLDFSMADILIIKFAAIMRCVT